VPFLNAPKISFKHDSLAFSLSLVLWDSLECEFFIKWRRHIELPYITISDLGLLYCLRYSLWKLGFLNGLEISFKQVSLECSL
jgi:hypothetical protein